MLSLQAQGRRPYCKVAGSLRVGLEGYRFEVLFSTDPRWQRPTCRMIRLVPQHSAWPGIKSTLSKLLSTLLHPRMARPAAFMLNIEILSIH